MTPEALAIRNATYRCFVELGRAPTADEVVAALKTAMGGFGAFAIVAVILTFIGDRLNLDLYLVALINFGFRIFNNVALIRRHFV